MDQRVILYYLFPVKYSRTDLIVIVVTGVFGVVVISTSDGVDQSLGHFG